MIIQKNSVFGFNIYKRQRIAYEKIEFEIRDIHCDDIGLYVIGENPHLEFNYVNIFEKRDWSKIAFETISLAILNLVLDQIIDIYEFEDKEYYLSGFHIRTIKGYHFKVLNSIKKDDLLSKDIFIKIKSVEKQIYVGDKLNKLIREILDIYLANGEFNRPQKRFVTEILKRYAKKLKWLKIEETTKLLGIYKDYKIDFNKIYIPRINMQHSDLKEAHKELFRDNPIYRRFTKKLKELLQNDFERRKPKND